ncbi:hypothetical protein MKW98_030331 [Papaver atlanticum]|uniref:Uncharacterized protein n=1 Tax=Papaver atlanticum TaxID=357466 RepID=A0AAD4TFX0_9MAGN|nr:hypothetical protein MKW98_030331 [Papaver atlanticum]
MASTSMCVLRQLHYEKERIGNWIQFGSIDWIQYGSSKNNWNMVLPPASSHDAGVATDVIINVPKVLPIANEEESCEQESDEDSLSGTSTVEYDYTEEEYPSEEEEDYEDSEVDATTIEEIRQVLQKTVSNNKCSIEMKENNEGEVGMANSTAIEENKEGEAGMTYSTQTEETKEDEL